MPVFLHHLTLKKTCKAGRRGARTEPTNQKATKRMNEYLKLENKIESEKLLLRERLWFMYTELKVKKRSLEHCESKSDFLRKKAYTHLQNTHFTDI